MEHPRVVKDTFDGRETLFQVKCDGEKDGFHRAIVALVGCRLRVETNPLKQFVKMFLVFPSQRATEL